MAGKQRKLTKNKRVKAVARKRIGSPKAARPLDERAIRQKPKYKETWTKEEGL